MAGSRASTGRRLAAGLAVVALLATGLALVTGTPASAAPPEPAATLSVPTSALIGDTVELSVTFDNADTDAVGYGPYVDLWLPATGIDGAASAVDDGITFTSASYLGTDVTALPITLTNCGGSQIHPFTGLPITCPSGFRVGDQLVVLELPFGSFSPGQPGAVIDVTAALSNLADLGAALPVAGRAGFRYGDTATGSTPIVQTVPDSAAIEPRLIEMDKQYLGPEDETATGPNFPRQYRLGVTVAPGQTVTDLDVTDLLPPNVAYLGVASSTPAGDTTVEPPTAGAPHNAPDNEVTVNFDSVVGTGDDDDAEVVIDVFVPEHDADGAPVIDPASGDDVLAIDAAEALGDWDPIDPRDAAATDNATAADDHELTPKSIAVQKHVAVVDDVGAGGPSPGDTLEWTVEFQVSDFFTFGAVSVTDVFTDGQTLDGSFAPALRFDDDDDTVDGAIPAGDLTLSRDDAPCGDGSSTLGVDVSSAVLGLGGTDGVLTGGLATGPDTGPTTGTITFRTVVDANYQCLDAGQTLDSRDELSNEVTIAGEVYDRATQAPQAEPQFEEDGSGAGVTIVAPGLVKSIYARNDEVPADPDDLGGLPNRTAFGPGESITYRLTATVPLTNVEGLRLEDYLPLPVLPAAGFSTTFDASANPTGLLPPAGAARLGSLDTFTAATGVVPTVVVDPVSNSLAFDFGDHQAEDGETAAVIDILLRLPLSDDPFVDGLYLTNQARLWTEDSFVDAQADDAIVQIELTQPVLEISKGVVAADSPAATFSPPTTGPVSFTPPPGATAAPRWAGTVSSTGLSTQPVNSNITGGVDAGDLVTHAIVVENTGSGLYGAFDVQISDSIPAGYEIPADADDFNLQVTNGAGDVLTYTDLGGGLFGTGIQLDDDAGPSPDLGALAAYDPTSGENIAVVTYNLALDHTTDPDPVSAGQLLTNTARVDAFAGAEGGPDHTGATSLTDTATVRTARPVVTKTITGTDRAHTTGNNVVVGEQVAYEVRIRVPEGTHPAFTVTDTLPTGLAFVSFDAASASAALSTTASGGTWATAGTTPAVTPVDAGAAGDGRVATWNFGTVTNSDRDDAVAEEIVLSYTTVVTNVSANQAAQTRRNSVITSYSTAAVNSPNVTIREPDVRVDKTVLPGLADAGDEVDFTITVTNQAGNTATAFDVALSDELPDGLEYVPGSFLHTAGVAPDTGPTAAGDTTLTAGWDQLANGASSTFTFSATVDDGIDIDALTTGVTNTALVAFSSLPGDETTTSALENSFGVERTGDTGDPGGSVNDHRHSDGATLLVNPASIEKSLVTTDEASTTQDPLLLTIGETATYDLLVTLPEGEIDDFTVTDAVPAGLGYVGGSVEVATSHPRLTEDFGGSLGSFTAAPLGDGADGQDLTLDFGPTTVSPGNPDDNAFVVTLDLRTLDGVGNHGDDPSTVPNEATVLSNTGSVTIGASTVTSEPVTATVVEPRMAITKTFTPGQAAANDPVEVTLEVTNEGTSTAFDVAVTDLLEGDAFPAADVAEATTPAGFTFAATPEGDNDTRITYTGGDLAVGETATFTFTVVLASSVTFPSSIVNTATVTDATTLPPGHAGEAFERNEPDVSGQDELVVTVPDLRVVKDDGVQVRSPGEAYVYTLTVHNDGARGATGVELADTLPPGLDLIGVSDGGTALAGVVTWPTFDLAAGASRAFLLFVEVHDPLEDDITDFQNDTSVTEDGTHGPDPTPLNNIDRDLDTTDAAVDLAVTKDDGNQTRTAGETFTYTIEVENQGNQDESGAELTDTLPPGVSFVSASDGGTEDAGTVTWPSFDLAGGASTSRTVTVTVDDPLAAGIHQLTNVATVDSPDDANPLNNSDVDTDTVAATPDLSVTKDDGETVVAPGQELTYTVVVTNHGDQGATGVEVVDTLPPGTSFVSASDGGTEDAGVVTWPTFALAGAGASVTYTVTVEVDDPVTEVELLNTVTVADDGTNGLDPTPEDNTATDLDVTVPDLRVVKDDGNQTRQPGDQVTYTVTVHNDGGLEATGVELTDVLPAELVFVGASDSGVHDGAPTGGDVTWALGTIAPGTSRTVTVTADLLASVPHGTTEIVNAAAAFDDGAGGPDPTPDNNADEDTDSVDASVDVGVVKDDGTQTRTAGETFTYTLDVTNHGDEDAVDVALSDTLPAGLDFVSASGGGTEDAGVVTWPAFDLGGGAATSRTVTVQVHAPLDAGVDDLVNGASVVAAGDVEPDNDTDSDTDVVDAAPDLTVTKDDGETVVAPGQTLTYTLVVTNDGDQDATGVALTDTLPAGVAFVSASGGGLESGGVVTWPLETVAGDGGTFSRTVTATVDDPATASVLTNTVTVADDGANGPDPTPESNTATDVDLVVADLRVVKDDGTQTRVPGEDYTYTLTVTNDGGADAVGVELVDELPSPLVFDAASDGGVHDGSTFGGDVEWDLGTIAGGASVTVTVDVHVRLPVPNGTTTITNTAVVTHDEVDGPDPTPANNEDRDEDSTLSVVDVGVVKDDGTQTRTPGEEYTYSLAVTNHGDEDAVDVEVVDTLPPGVTFVSASDGGTEAAGAVSWPRFALAGDGGSATRTVTVEVDDPIAAGIDELVNTVAIEAPGDTNAANDTDSDTDEVAATPDLQVTKDDGETVVGPGQTLTYTLTITNNGDQDATGVVITDDLPVGTALVAASDGGTGVGTITWPAFDLAGGGGSVTRTVTVLVDDPIAGTLSLTNTAQVTDDGANGPDPTPEDNTATDVDLTVADLRVVKDDGVQTRVPGEDYTYSITVFNDGGADAVGVDLVDELPSQLVFDAASDGGVHDGSAFGGDVEWDLGTIAGGDSVTVTVDVHVRRPVPNGTTDIVNTAAATHEEVDGPDPTPANNEDSDEDTTESVIDVGIEKDDGTQTRTPGEEYTYTLTVTNHGDEDAVDVAVSDTLPAGLAFVSASDGGTEAAGVVTWPRFALAGDGGSATRTVTVEVDDPIAAGIDDLVNQAAVDAPDDVDDDNDTDSDTDEVDATPDLQVVKDDGEEVVAPGQSLTYSLEVTNVGDQDATGVVLTDTLPIGVAFVSASDGGTESGGVVTWPAVALTGRGGALTRTVTVTVDDPLNGILDLTNTAQATDDGDNGPDPTPADNTATDVDLTVADLRVVKDDGNQTRVPGDEFTYSITVFNDGGADAAGVELVDALPSELEFLAASGGGTHDGSPFGGDVTWDLGPLAGGGNTTLTVDVRLRLPVPNGTEEVVNPAAVTHDEVDGPDPTPANNDDRDTDAVHASVDVGIEKDDGTQVRTPGEQFTYTLDVTNHGDEDAVDVAVSDTLPAGLAFVSASDGGTEAAGVVTWPRFALAGDGGSTTRTVTVEVDDPIAAGIDDLVNQAAVAAPDDADPANDTDSDTDEVDANPDLSITKTDGQATAIEGETLTYTLVVTNSGDQGATGATIVDTLPVGVTFVSASDGGTESGGEVTWPAAALAGGGADLTRTVTVTVDQPLPTGTTELVNVVDVADDGLNGADPTPEDNSATDTDVTGADLWVTKASPTTVPVPGRTVTWVITVGHDGPETVEDLILEETIPSAVVDVDYEPSVGTYDAATGAWSGLSLAPGGTITLTVVGRLDPTARGLLHNEVRVDPVGHADPDLSDNEAEHDAVLDPDFDLDLAKELTSPLERGRVARWRLTVTNHGPSAVGGVRVVDHLPVGLTFIGTARSEAWSCDVVGRRVTCARPGMLGPDGTWRLTLLTRVAGDLEGQVRNVATVAAAGETGTPEQNLNNNVDAAGADLGQLPGDPLPPAIDGDGDGGTLPRTGAGVLGLVLLGLALVGGGSILRRRRADGAPST